MFYFDGLNTSEYIAAEDRQPHRSLPAALITGTAIVTAIYVGLNMLFLYALGIEGMSGVLQVGEKASLALFGPVATHVVASMMALSILASASAMIIAGPRVYFAMAADRVFFKKTGKIHTVYGSPATAIVWQAVWISVLFLFGSFQFLLILY